jgi:hypothetical protein
MWAGGSVSQYSCTPANLFPSAPSLPWDPHWHRIFHLVIFHTHNLPCYEYQRSTSLAIPRVSHNMPKTFINSDLIHFWECQGCGEKKNRAKGRLGENFAQYSCTDYFKNYEQILVTMQTLELVLGTLV